MGLLDGGIASLVFQGLSQAGMTKPATLIKIAAGSRTPGAISAGTHPVSTSHPVTAVPGNITQMRLDGSLIAGVDRVIRIFGASLPSGVVPAPNDKITMDGVTSVIVGDSGGNRAVDADPAGACYVCQCKG